jgi:hypothetical protein
MEINCETCPVREIHCADCVVNLFLEQPRVRTNLLPAEAAALEVLVKSGLVAGNSGAQVVQIDVRASA